MAYTALPFSGDLGQVDMGTSIENMPPMPRLFGLGAALMEGLAQTPENYVYNQIKESVIENTDAGAKMTPQDIKEQYPDVADQFPDGGFKNLVEFADKKTSSENVRQSIMNAMPEGFLSEATKFAGMIVGGSMSPSGAAFAHGVGALIKPVGRAVETGIMARFGEQAAATKLAARVALGVTESSAVVTPYAASSYLYYKDLHKEVSMMDYLPMYLIGAGLGGLLRGVGGFDKIVPNETVDNIVNTMQDQAENGKKINVEPIIKQGIFEQAKINTEAEGLTREEINTRQEEMRGQSAQLDEQINQTKKDFEKEREQFPFKKQLGEVAPDLESPSRSGMDIADHANNISGIAETLRTKKQENFLKTIPDTYEMKKAMTLSAIPKEKLTIEDSKFLERFKTDERGLTQEGMDMKKSALEKVTAKLDKESLDEGERGMLEEQERTLQDRIDKSQERIEELDQMATRPKIEELRKQYGDLTAQRDDLQERIKNTDAYNLLMDTTQPVNKQDLQASMNKMDSFKGAETYDEKIYQEAKNTIETQREKEIETNKQLDDVFKDLDEGGKLSDKTKGVLKELKENREKRSTFDKSLELLNKCLSEHGA